MIDIIASLPVSLRRALEVKTYNTPIPRFYDESIPVIDKNSPDFKFLQEILARFKKNLTPAEPETIKVLLGRLSLHYPMANRSEAQFALMMDDYLEDLNFIPSDILANACRRYRQSIENKYFPRSAELRELAKEELVVRTMQYKKLCKIWNKAFVVNSHAEYL